MNRILTWLIKKFLHNFGEVIPGEVYRSGQHKHIALYVHHWLYPFQTVINLSWSPKTDPMDVFEREFCRKRFIRYYPFQWGAGGLKDWDEINVAMDVIDTSRGPVWIHCEGGKDRTGGLIAHWKKYRVGSSMDDIFNDFEVYKYPYWAWIKHLFTEDK